MPVSFTSIIVQSKEVERFTLFGEALPETHSTSRKSFRLQQPWITWNCNCVLTQTPPPYDNKNTERVHFLIVNPEINLIRHNDRPGPLKVNPHLS